MAKRSSIAALQSRSDSEKCDETPFQLSAVKQIPILLLAFSAALAPLPALAKTHRDPHQRAAFMQQHPCPSTGKTSSAGPGYAVDHSMPLVPAGRDHLSTRQWQTREDHDAAW